MNRRSKSAEYSTSDAANGRVGDWLRCSGRVCGVVAALAAAAVLGPALSAAPPVGGPSKLPELSDPQTPAPTPITCGWGQVFDSSQELPDPWTDSDWNPFTSGSGSGTGAGANLTLKGKVWTSCSLPSLVCDCWSISTPVLVASGWIKSTVAPMPNSQQQKPVVFECNVKGTVVLEGDLDPENWCIWFDGCASVSASLQLYTWGSIPSANANWGEPLVYRVDGSICEGGTTVSVGAGAGPSGVEMNAGLSWTTTSPFQYRYNQTFRRRWQWCGDPSGVWVRLTTDYSGSAHGTNGGDARFHVEVKDAVVEFSISECQCVGGGGQPTPLQHNGDGFQ